MQKFCIYLIFSSRCKESCLEDTESKFLDLDFISEECDDVSCQSELSFHYSLVEPEDNRSMSPSALFAHSRPGSLREAGLENEEIQEGTVMPSFLDAPFYSQPISEDWCGDQRSVDGCTLAGTDVPINCKLSRQLIDTWSPDVISASQGNHGWPSVGRKHSLAHPEVQSHDFKGAAPEVAVQCSDKQGYLDIKMIYENEDNPQSFQNRQDDKEMRIGGSYMQLRLVSGSGTDRVNGHGFEVFDLDFTDTDENDFDSWPDACFAEKES